MPNIDFFHKLQQLLIFLPFFMISITCHEVAHGYAAFRLGDRTAKDAGRLTMNPMAHIDPIGSLMFIISFFAGMGFGWAKPVPVDPRYFKNPRRDDIIVSLAGVAANLTLVIICVFAMRALAPLYPSLSQAGRLIVGILAQFMVLNTVLAVFNLIPIPPLDGSHVLMALLPLQQARVYAQIRPYGFIILILLLNTPVLNTLFSFAIGVVYLLAGIH